MANDIKTKVEHVTGEKVKKIVETVAKKEAEQKEPVHKEKMKQLIYVGPNLLGLPKYTVFESEKVPHLQNFIEECPAIKELVVPIAEMSEIEARTVQKGTLEYRFVQDIIKFKVGAK